MSADSMEHHCLGDHWWWWWWSIPLGAKAAADEWAAAADKWSKESAAFLPFHHSQLNSRRLASAGGQSEQATVLLVPVPRHWAVIEQPFEAGLICQSRIERFWQGCQAMWTCTSVCVCVVVAPAFCSDDEPEKAAAHHYRLPPPPHKSSHWEAY